MSNRLTIQQVADELEVSTKTLRRWEVSGLLVPEREPDTNIRLYHPYLIGYWKKLLTLDRTLRDHLKLLDGLRKELDKYMLEQDYVPGKPLKLFDKDSASSFFEASEKMDKWEKDYKKLLEELMTYPKNMVKATTEEYEGKNKK